jgi:hypothetical protein
VREFNKDSMQRKARSEMLITLLMDFKCVEYPFSSRIQKIKREGRKIFQIVVKAGTNSHSCMIMTVWKR